MAFEINILFYRLYMKYGVCFLARKTTHNVEWVKEGHCEWFNYLISEVLGLNFL